MEDAGQPLEWVNAICAHTVVYFRGLMLLCVNHKIIGSLPRTPVHSSVHTRQADVFLVWVPSAALVPLALSRIVWFKVAATLALRLRGHLHEDFERD